MPRKIKKLEKLRIVVERDTDGSYIATSPDTDIYGVGETWYGAIKDFADMLGEMSDELMRNELLSAGMLRLKSWLCEKENPDA